MWKALESCQESYGKEDRGEEVKIMSIGYSLRSLPVKLGEYKLEVDKNKDLKMFIF